MDWEKIICSILLLISLTCCISGPFAVKATQTSYQAEENHNVTLEWMFSTMTNRALDSFIIYCEMLTDLKASVVFHLHGGVEVLKFQDKQFAGRIRYDEDVLREGRLRLHVSRLRTDDSGVYVCQVIINADVSFSECHLNVTAAGDRPEPEGQDAVSRGWIGLYCALLAAAALLAVSFCFFVHSLCRKRDSWSRGGFKRVNSSVRGSVETV